MAEKPDAIDAPGIQGRVEFDDVSLRYPGADRDTLSDVRSPIAPGTTVAIVGATGSGKTSLVNLVPRFYDATEGTVLIDGIDVRDVTLVSLRSQIGIVMQESVLFSGRCATTSPTVGPTRARRHRRRGRGAAQADEFIRNLPDGYDTRVGERG